MPNKAIWQKTLVYILFEVSSCKFNSHKRPCMKMNFGENILHFLSERTKYTNKLNWNKQKEEQCKTISNNINLLKNAKDVVALDTVKFFYTTFSYTSFTYCSTYSACGKIITKRIDKLGKRQKRVARHSITDEFSDHSIKVLTNFPGAYLDSH